MINKVAANIFPETYRDTIKHLFGNGLSQSVLLPMQKIAQMPEGEIRSLLHPEEVRKALGFRLEKRRDEYITGRLCARYALSLFLKNQDINVEKQWLQTLQVVNDQEGRPSFSHDGPEPLPSLSIAHSGGFGIAVVCPADIVCGVDLQRNQDTLQRIRDRFCTQQELQLLADNLHKPGPEIILLNRLWSAKEAARKLLGHWKLPGFLDMKLKEVSILDDALLSLSLHYKHQTKHTSNSIRILSGIFQENYSLAITFMPKDNGAR